MKTPLRSVEQKAVAIYIKTAQKMNSSPQEVTCPLCQGEGYGIHFKPGFSGFSEVFEPVESYQDCPLCLGKGEILLCASCQETFRIKAGREVCGCTQAALAKAA